MLTTLIHNFLFMSYKVWGNILQLEHKETIYITLSPSWQRYYHQNTGSSSKSKNSLPFRESTDYDLFRMIHYLVFLIFNIALYLVRYVLKLSSQYHVNLKGLGVPSSPVDG